MTLTEFVLSQPGTMSPKEIADAAVKAGFGKATNKSVATLRWIARNKSAKHGSAPLEAPKRKRGPAPLTRDPLYTMIVKRGTAAAQAMIDHINTHHAN